MNKENKKTSVIKLPCIVKIYRGIPIENNDYKQYLKIDELNLNIIRNKSINQTFRRNSPNLI
jgi:hypothetical protein